MSTTAHAIEVSGVIDQHHRLIVQEPLPVAGPANVRVIVLVDMRGDDDEQAWLRNAACSSAYEFLKDSVEDVYTIRDGEAIYEA